MISQREEEDRADDFAANTMIDIAAYKSFIIEEISR